jgi:quercetin dioxygenase-like cupin family protein
VSTMFAGGSVRRDLFGGHGEVQVRTLAVPPGLPAPFTAALACVLEASGHVGSHRQDHDDEVVLVVEGQGEATVNGQVMPLSPGAVVPVPLGAVLSIRAGPHQPLQYLIIKASQPR